MYAGDEVISDDQIDDADYPIRTFLCPCGLDVEVWEPGADVTCECGQMFNAFGQRVNCSLQDIDPADAGERWDD